MPRRLLIVPFAVAMLALGAACSIFPVHIPQPPLPAPTACPGSVRACQPLPTACSGSAATCVASPTPCKAAKCLPTATPCTTDECLPMPPTCPPITTASGSVNPAYVCYPPPLGTATPCPQGRVCPYSAAAVRP